MITEKLRRRARALAAHAAGEGAESDVAAKLLSDLVREHPGLSHWLEAGAAERVEVEFDAPTLGHRQILAEYAFRCRCEAVAEPVADTAVSVVRVRGERARVRRVAEAYEPHGRALTLLYEMLGAVYLDQLVPELSGEETAELLSEMDKEEVDALAGLGPPPLDAHVPTEADKRWERVRRALPRAPILSACERLVRLSQPARERPSHLIGGRSVAWDSPDMTYDDFLRLYRGFFPKGNLLEYQLAQNYRDGHRIYPPTRSWRVVKALVRPFEDLPERPAWWG